MAKKRKTKTPQIKGLYLKHDHFVYQPPQVKGVRPKPIHLSTSDLVEALQQIEEIKQREFVKAKTHPVAESVAQYLVSKAARGDHKGQVTTLNAKAALKRFSNFFTCSPSKITGKDIVRWKESMLAERKLDKSGKPTKAPALSRASVTGYMRYAQSFLSWMVEQGHILRSPFSGLPKDTFPKSIPTRRDLFCTKALRDELIDECDDLALKAVLFIGFHTGMRRDEILNIRPHWILKDEKGNPTHFRVQNENGSDGTTQFAIKDNEAKIVPINDSLAKFLSDYGIERSPYLIRPDLEGGKNKYRWEWKRRWNTYMKKHECEWVTPHVMRHTFITLMLSAPADKRPSLLHIERWTGTASETLKKSYAHLIEDRDLINAAN